METVRRNWRELLSISHASDRTVEFSVSILTQERLNTTSNTKVVTIFTLHESVLFVCGSISVKAQLHTEKTHGDKVVTHCGVVIAPKIFLVHTNLGFYKECNHLCGIPLRTYTSINTVGETINVLLLEYVET